MYRQQFSEEVFTTEQLNSDLSTRNLRWQILRTPSYKFKHHRLTPLDQK
jgi:hypothetical protein